MWRRQISARTCINVWLMKSSLWQYITRLYKLYNPSVWLHKCSRWGSKPRPSLTARVSNYKSESLRQPMSDRVDEWPSLPVLLCSEPLHMPALQTCQRCVFISLLFESAPQREWAVGDRTNIKAWQLIQHFLMNKRARIYRPLSLRQGKKLENWSRMSEIRYTPEDSVLSASFKSKIHHLGDAGTMNNLEKIT